MSAAPVPLPVDNALHDVRMDGVFFFRTWIDGPFARALEAGDFSYCVMVRAGRLRLETDFPQAPSIELGAGDAVSISGRAPHVFTSIVAPHAAAPTAFARHPLPDDGRRAELELVVGVAPNQQLALGTVLIGPVVVRPSEHPDLSRRLWRAVEMLEDEYADASWIDRNLVIRRMAETMAVNFSRRIFADRRLRTDQAPAPPNRQVLSAINAIFAAPERAWTLGELAKAAGMSRTCFAEQFKLTTGETPGRIITRVRLTTAARRLAGAGVSVEVAAAEAGYSSAAAFVRAFQREFDETPARWRRLRRHPDLPRTPPRSAPVLAPARGAADAAR